MKQNNKKLNQINAIMVLALILGLTIWAGYWVLKNKTVIINQVNEVNREMTNWQTYKNKDYNFEIKYPYDWKLEIAQKFYKENRSPEFGGIYIYKEQMDQGLRYSLSIFIEENPQNLSAKKYVEKTIEDNKTSFQKGEAPYLWDYQSTSEVKINRYLGYAIFGLDDLEGKVDRLYLSKNNKTFVFIYPIAEENPNYFDPIENYKIVQKILSTFKFIE